VPGDDVSSLLEQARAKANGMAAARKFRFIEHLTGKQRVGTLSGVASARQWTCRRTVGYSRHAEILPLDDGVDGVDGRMGRGMLER